MLGYRRKILISDALLFCLFAVLLYFCVERASKNALDTEALKFRVLLFGGGCLLLYSLSAGAIMHRLSRPLQRIIDAIIPHTEGEVLPQILIERSMEKGEFGKLAMHLNALTERVERQIERYRQHSEETEEILQSLAEGVLAVDTRGDIVFFNKMASQMLKALPNAVLGRPLTELQIESRGLFAKCHEVIQEALQTSEPVQETWQEKEAKKRYFALCAAPRVGHRGAILVIQDKTSDYKMLEMGKDFIANASHELKTPITIIQGFAEMIQDHPNLSSEILSDIAGKIVRTSGRLDRLIQALLTLSDAENIAELKYQTIDLEKFIGQCKHWLLTSYPEAKITISHPSTRCNLVGDPLLLDLAITNLLENAVKYSVSTPLISIAIESAAGEIHMKITDQGIGIPESDLPHIFDRFYTVDKARSRKSGGAGLGLAIVKTIIDKHGGKISVASELGKGSQFVISFPLPSPSLKGL